MHAEPIPVTKGLGALSENTLLRYISFTAFYMAQGLPLGILVVALPAWLAGQNLSAAEIGEFVAVATIPWSLKIVWGPLMDRYGFLPMGRRRPWVIGAQLGLVLSVFALALLEDPAAQLSVVAALGFAISLFSSMQDVAVDGMAIDALPEEQRARVNGLMMGGQVLGMSGSAAAGGMLLSEYGLSVAVLPVGVLIGLILLLTISVRERPGERLLPWTAGEASGKAIELQMDDWKRLLKSLLRAFVLPMSLVAIAAIFVLRIGSGILQAFLPVLTVQDLGWQDTDYANLQALANVVSGAFAVLVGGPIVDRFGALRMARISGVLWIVLGIAAFALTDLWAVPTAVTAYMIAVNILAIILFISFAAVFMGMCWQRVAATLFALYMALTNLGLSAGSALMGTLTSAFSQAQIFLVVAVCGGGLLLLLAFLDLDSHRRRVEAL
jgi:MFS transporter, PAT family, beta-lactamase induction signal transducer AmpG